MNTPTASPKAHQTAQFTPGPWRLWRDLDHREPLSIVGPSEDFTCTIAMENTQAQADARLIAAAPDLFAALESITASYDALLAEYGKAHGWGTIESDVARVALNKAIGQLP